MSHYNTDYKGLPRGEADKKAIQDIRDYLSQEQWDCFMQGVGDPKMTIKGLNFAFGFVGVQGYPFHAFCRKYVLDKYRAWMASGDDPVQTDAQGFTIEKGK